jgi:flagellar hook protein FlgE
MALTSALFTGLSGLNVNQTRLNVVGNNIANANTIAFKSSRALFAPQFYITEGGGGPPTGDFGGTNPSQRGLGASVSAIEKDFTQGALETTGKKTDLAIDGKGFFVVEGAERGYTREGAFVLNADNKLVTQSGQYVLGYGADDAGNIIQGQLEQLNVPADIKSEAKATADVVLQGNLDADGDVATGASVLTTSATTPLQSLSAAPVINDTTLLSDLTLDGTTPLFNPAGTPPDTLTIAGKKGGRTLTPLDFEIDPTSTVRNLLDFYNQGLQIKTDETNPPGVAAPGAAFDPLTNTIKITGNAGKDNALALSGTSFKSTNPNTRLTFGDDPTSKPDGESIFTSFEVFDSLGTPVTIDIETHLEEKTDAGSTWRFTASSPDNTRAGTFDPASTGAGAFAGAILGSGTITFDTDGQLVGTTGGTVNLDRSATGATAQQAINLDFTQLSALSARKSTLVLDSQNGVPTGLINGFEIGANGIVTGTFSNGQSRTLGQLALALFDNPAGLVDQGGNLYLSGANSGDPSITAPTELDSGAIRSGTLELSNVDLSREFVNLIISTTGFTAASRVITTSDQLITELLNTAR